MLLKAVCVSGEQPGFCCQSGSTSTKRSTGRTPRYAGLATMLSLLAMAVLSGSAMAGERDEPRVDKVHASLDGPPQVNTQYAPAEGSVAALTGDCIPFGSLDRFFITGFPPERYRGNLYRIDTGAAMVAVLREIAVDFVIDVDPVDLIFTVHQTRSDSGDPFVQIFEKTVSSSGDGIQVVTYASGPIGGMAGLPLQNGFDYAIGVSWSSSSLIYFQDTGPYPRSFLHGQVRGSVAANLSPAPANFANLFIFTGGAYAMQLCFDPVPGACCVSGLGTCEDRLEVDCPIGDGSFFHGQRTTCADFGGNCVFGACCDPCAICSDNHTPEACDVLNGNWAGPGVVCGAGVCQIVTGACCDGATCDDAGCEADCILRGGTYLGDGTDCQPNMCVGACCIPGVGCDNLPSAVCSLFSPNGYHGDGTTCDSLAPAEECGGGCCATILGTRRCVPVANRDLCTEAQSLVDPVYLGDASFCADCATLGVTGACCQPDGSCLITTEDACPPESFSAGEPNCDATTCVACCIDNPDAMASPPTVCSVIPGACASPHGIDNCTIDTCDVQTGSCCFNDIATPCKDGDTQDTCELAGGRFVAGSTTCATDCAAIVFGACCRPNGTCSENLTSAECMPLDGTLFAGLTCAEATCPVRGACCSSDGTCTIKLEGDCVGAFDTFSGAGTVCNATSCPTGGCCANGLCTDLTSGACAGPDQTYRGDGTVCDESAFCEVELTACCASDNTCTDVLRQDCFDGGDTVRTLGTTCATDPCRKAACCIAGGDPACVENLRAEECAAMGGVLSIGSQSCTEGACDPMGACCNNSTCEVLPQVLCESTGGIYQGDDVVCDIGFCTPAACCVAADSSCTDNLTPIECTALGGVQSLSSLSCANGACDPMGACCANSFCSITTAALCDFGGGFYQGDDAACVMDLCTPSACCVRGDCLDRIESRCTDPEAVFMAGTVCSSSPCEPFGGCCRRDGTCDSDISQSQCDARNGVLTVGGSCGLLLCDPIGACCMGDGTCMDDVVQFDCTSAGGTFQGGDSVCPGPNCGACCRLTGCESATISTRCVDSFDFFEPGFDCTELACPVRGACCIDGQGCLDALTEVDCAEQGGMYDGDGSICRPDLCELGACCVLGGTSCLMLTLQECDMRAGGVYNGAMVGCDSVACDRGSCCEADGELLTCLDIVVASECVVPEDFTPGGTCFDCEDRGACCVPGDAVCQVVPRSQCNAVGSIYSGPATTCDQTDLCEVGACCQSDGVCSDTLTRQRCERGGGTYIGAGRVCVPNICAGGIINSAPPNCAIDAGQPTDPDGTNAAGWDAVELGFGFDPSGLTVGDFSVRTVPGSVPTPVVLSVSPGVGVNSIVLQLDGPIPAGQWTCFTHTLSQAELCLGSLPGDVSSNGTSDAADITSLVDCITGVTTCDIWQCDADRSKLCTPADMLRVIDLLSGGDQFEVWSARALPPCPTGP